MRLLSLADDGIAVNCVSLAEASLWTAFLNATPSNLRFPRFHFPRLTSAVEKGKKPVFGGCEENHMILRVTELTIEGIECRNRELFERSSGPTKKTRRNMAANLMARTFSCGSVFRAT
jgi:hypothetical protein